MHSLPRPSLLPLLPTWSAEFARVRQQVARVTDAIPYDVESVRVVRETLHLRRERPFRVANQRRRLTACYWAAACPEGFVTRGLLRTPLIARHGASRPTWLVSGVAR